MRFPAAEQEVQGFGSPRSTMSTTMASLDAPRRKERWSSFAAFANPDGSLPGAEAEVTSVAREVFRGATVFVGPKAVAEAVRDIAGKARILHFATHGVLGGEAAASYLKMAKGPLTLDLISGLDFGDTTDLVVLSACQTAVAVGETAEEGISIAEAFAFGGVPTLASVGPINGMMDRAAIANRLGTRLNG